MATGHGGADRPLPGYVLRDPIGRGATAEVWRGEPDGRPGRVVAIKRLRTDADRSSLEALRRDAEALAKLSHPSILPILDIVEDDPGVAIVTRYAAGGSLADWLGRIRGGLDPVQVADLGARVGAALAASHNAGIVHGDLKPANILFDAEGQPLVADFGASRLRGTSEPVIGTAEYLDPASLVDGRPSEATTDVYGLATTLYEALTGVPPYAGSSPQQTLAAADRGIHVPASDLVEVPTDLAATIERGLRREPADRFATIAEMASHLDESRRRLGSAPSSPPADTPAAIRPSMAPSARADEPHGPPPSPRERSGTTLFGPRPPTADAPPATPPGLDRRLLIVAAILVIAIPIGIVTWLSTSSADAPLEPTPGTDDRATDDSPGDGSEEAADDAIDVDPDERADGGSELRDPPPDCPDAVTPTLTAPTQPADVDGQGCSVPAAWDGRVLEVAIDGDLQRFDLPGDGQDMLLFGDFSCDGRETPALYRPSSGEVFVFPILDPDDEVTVRAQPDEVPDATARVVVDAQGCARVDLDPGTG
jgi:eukaryotic-like serine/threonine-protein kinase